MAWMDGIFKRFLRYWTRSEKGKEEKPFFWEEAAQREEASDEKQQELKNSRARKEIFYIEQEKQDFKGARKAETIPVFQKVILKREEIEKTQNRSVFLQKEKGKRKKEVVGKWVVQPFFADFEGEWFPFEMAVQEKKSESILQEAESGILEKDFFPKEKKAESIFEIEKKEEAKERKKVGKSPIVQEMEREYRTEVLLQQMIQKKSEHIKEPEQPKISVQIGQVQKSTDIDKIMAEMTSRLWEARSVGRCGTERS